MFASGLSALAGATVLSMALAQPLSYFTATAIVNTADQRASTLQCWNLTTPFVPEATAGAQQGTISLTLGDVTNATYFWRPPHLVDDLHTAPYPQIVVYLSGFADITVPGSTEHARILGGRNGLIFAMDTMGEGHLSSYLSNEPTTGLTMPLAGGKAPEHVVIADGKACDFQEQIVPAM